tara:strand:+ start:5173 stop:5679 length:507 start_codon:yes stop_codon:yes gene_type:complete
MLDNIPHDVINVIKEFLPINVLFYTSKKYFEKYYINYRLFINKNNNNNVVDNYLLHISNDYYIRGNHFLQLKYNAINNSRYLNMIIRFDHDYIFKTVMDQKFKFWKKLKNYYYNGSKYPNYITFLESLCIKYNSNNCRNIINENNEIEYKLRKKRYKKIKTIHNRWTS